LAATEHLVGEQQQLKADVARLEHDVRSATARSSEVPSFSLRTDISRLEQQLADQDEALDSLRKTVEGLRRKPSQPPAAKRTPRAKAD
jgi:phage shock protein A